MKHSRIAARVSFTVVLIIWSVLTISTALLRPEIVATESFDYDTPTIRGCNGGEGWADAWTGDNLISRGSLRFPDFESKGNRLTTLGDSAGKSDSIKCSFRTLAVTGRDHLVIDGKFGRSGTTLWLAFLANIPEGANLRKGIFGGVSLLDDRRERVFLGRCSPQNMWAFECSGELQRFSNVSADTNVAFLVYKMTFRPGGTQFEMWANPKPGTNDLSSADVVAAEVVRAFRFNRLRICSAPSRLGLDELRLGTTYADVAPQQQKR